MYTIVLRFYQNVWKHYADKFPIRHNPIEFERLWNSWWLLSKYWSSYANISWKILIVLQIYVGTASRRLPTTGQVCLIFFNSGHDRLSWPELKKIKLTWLTQSMEKCNGKVKVVSIIMTILPECQWAKKNMGISPMQTIRLKAWKGVPLLLRSYSYIGDSCQDYTDTITPHPPFTNARERPVVIKWKFVLSLNRGVVCKCARKTLNCVYLI